MTDASYRHIIFIIDRSGSIQSVLPDMQGGYEQFVKEQAAVEGISTSASLYQFDTEHENLFSFQALHHLKAYKIVPRGGTALLDAIGYALVTEGGKLAALREENRPGKVIVLICTDGEENSSRKYTKAQVKAMISEQQDTYGWTFIYNGANQDAFAEAGAMGIATCSTMGYAATPQGTAGSWASASAMVTRGAASGTYAYTGNERKAASGD